MDRNLLIDGNHAMHRAFYSVPDSMTAPDKTIPTNAVHGFFQILIKAVDVFEPTNVIVCWDKGKNQERLALIPSYKDGRAKMNDNLKVQFTIVRDLLDVLMVPQYRVHNCEADDLIGSIANQTEDLGYQNYIFSGDHDMFQLITEQTNVATPKRGGEILVYNPTKIFEEYGIYPHQYVDYIGIKGDSSDVIKGIEGLGPKNASKLIQEYGTLEEVINAAKTGTMAGKIAEKIIAGEESALVSKKVATIDCNLQVDLDLKIPWGSYSNIDGAFQYYGLQSTLNKLTKRSSKIISVPVIEVKKEEDDLQDTLF